MYDDSGSHSLSGRITLLCSSEIRNEQISLNKNRRLSNCILILYEVKEYDKVPCMQREWRLGGLAPYVQQQTEDLEITGYNGPVSVLHPGASHVNLLWVVHGNLLQTEKYFTPDSKSVPLIRSSVHQ